ncbi:glycosyltransferase family 2 protein [Mannheimia haemolytica]|nr:glycosyltransferase family 2 protein [Mannheimia haemolytica]
MIYSLNKAINLSSGEYIARMDADDISLPTRLSRANFIFRKKTIRTMRL